MRNTLLSPLSPGITPLDSLPTGGETPGERLARLRKAKGLSQADLAGLMSVSIASVCYWESGRSQPRVARLRSLAALLDAPDVLRPDFAAGRPDLHELVAHARAEIANAAGISPAKVKIIIEI